MQHYDIFLFDWDGTLMDSTAIWLGVVREGLAEQGFDVPDREILERLGDLDRTRELGLNEKQILKLREWARTRAKVLMLDAPLFPKASEVLHTLKRHGKKLGVVTALSDGLITSMLAHHQYQNLFDVVVSGTEVQHLKPHPEGVLRALERLGFEAGQRAVMSGDTSRDILAAHGAGIDSLLFFPPEHAVFHDLDQLRTHGPTHVVTDWKEFLTQL